MSLRFHTPEVPHDSVEVSLKNDDGDVDIYVDDVRVAFFSSERMGIMVCHLGTQEMIALEGMGVKVTDTNQIAIV